CHRDIGRPSASRGRSGRRGEGGSDGIAPADEPPPESLIGSCGLPVGDEAAPPPPPPLGPDGEDDGDGGDEEGEDEGGGGVGVHGGGPPEGEGGDEGDEGDEGEGGPSGGGAPSDGGGSPPSRPPTTRRYLRIFDSLSEPVISVPTYDDGAAGSASALGASVPIFGCWYCARASAARNVRSETISASRIRIEACSAVARSRITN